MPIKPVHIQRRMMQLGRVRLGEKGPKGEPKKLNTFRFTSASRQLLDAVAAAHGGTVEEWQGAPDEGYFQVTTDATRLDIVLPPVYSDIDGTPTLPYSQWFEMWSGAGCQRRCDGETEAISGKPCMCDPEKRKEGAATACKVTTRVSFMLPDIPGLGVWRLDSHGWNAAVELPGTLEVLARAAEEMRFIPAVLSIQHRTKKEDGQTRRFIVPVIELPDVTVRQLVSGDVPMALNAPVSVNRERPELPAAPAPPEEPLAHEPHVEHGPRPALPSDGRGDEIGRLTEELLGFARARRDLTEVRQRIADNVKKHGPQSDEHLEWLRQQRERAAAAAGGESEFVAMARQAGAPV